MLAAAVAAAAAHFAGHIYSSASLAASVAGNAASGWTPGVCLTPDHDRSAAALVCQIWPTDLIDVAVYFIIEGRDLRLHVLLRCAVLCC